MKDKPAISVIIAAYRARATISDCLASLQNQEGDIELEVILIESSNDGAAELVRREFPQVKVLEFRERKFCGDARNIGIANTRGDVIAFLDADCTASPTWAKEIIEAHCRPELAIGGAICNANPKSLVGWAGFLLEYSQWMPGTRHGYVGDIAGASMSYKRRVFNELGGFIEQTYCSDTEFHWRLAEVGQRLWFEPRIVVCHRNTESLPQLLAHELSHGRYFGRVRAKSRFSVAKRMLYVAGSAGIPLKILTTTALRCVRHRRSLPKFIASSPMIVMCAIAWSAGECLGYAGG